MTAKYECMVTFRRIQAKLEGIEKTRAPAPPIGPRPPDDLLLSEALKKAKKTWEL